MGLTAAAGAYQYKPALSVSSVLFGGLKSTRKKRLPPYVPAYSALNNTLKSATDQSAQIAVLLQPVLLFIFRRQFDAAAGGHTAEIRLPRGQSRMHKTAPFADRAVDVPGRFYGLFIAGPCVRSVL